VSFDGSLAVVCRDALRVDTFSLAAIVTLALGIETLSTE
jgi:hypothetical protein